MAIDTKTTVNSAAAEPGPAPKVRRLAWWQWLVFALLIGLLGLVAFQMSRSGPLAAGQVGNGEPAPTAPAVPETPAAAAPVDEYAQRLERELQQRR